MRLANECQGFDFCCAFKTLLTGEIVKCQFSFDGELHPYMWTLFHEDCIKDFEVAVRCLYLMHTKIPNFFIKLLERAVADKIYFVNLVIHY